MGCRMMLVKDAPLVACEWGNPDDKTSIAWRCLDLIELCVARALAKNRDVRAYQSLVDRQLLQRTPEPVRHVSSGRSILTGENRGQGAQLSSRRHWMPNMATAVAQAWRYRLVMGRISSTRMLFYKIDVRKTYRNPRKRGIFAIRLNSPKRKRSRHM